MVPTQLILLTSIAVNQASAKDLCTEIENTDFLPTLPQAYQNKLGVANLEDRVLSLDGYMGCASFASSITDYKYGEDLLTPELEKTICTNADCKVLFNTTLSIMNAYEDYSCIPIDLDEIKSRMAREISVAGECPDGSFIDVVAAIPEREACTETENAEVTKTLPDVYQAALLTDQDFKSFPGFEECAPVLQSIGFQGAALTPAQEVEVCGNPGCSEFLKLTQSIADAFESATCKHSAFDVANVDLSFWSPFAAACSPAPTLALSSAPVVVSSMMMTMSFIILVLAVW